MVEHHTARGISWTLLTYVVSKGFTLATTVVLARLLVPGDFGVVALGFLVIGVLSLASDLGLGSTLILRPDLDERGRGTILGLLLAMGLLITVVLLAGAPLAAGLFHEPRLAGVQAGLSGLGIIGAVCWFYGCDLQREMRFGAIFVATALQAAIYAAVAIVLAALGAGVWSLVAGQVAGTTAQAVAYLLLASRRVRPAFDRSQLGSLLRTSRGFVLQGAAAFASTNADYLAVGRVLGATPLGYYTLAYRLGELPVIGIADPVAKVTFPRFAMMRERGEPIEAAFLASLGMVALLCAPIAILMAAVAQPLVLLAYGDQWLPMVAVVSVLGIWGALRSVQSQISWLLNSTGHAGLSGGLSAGALVVTVPALFVAAQQHGIRGVAWVMVGNVLITLTAQLTAVARVIGVRVGAQLIAVAPVALACVPAWFAARTVADALVHQPPLTGVATGILAGGAAYLAVMLALGRPLLSRAAAQGRLMMRRGGPVPARAA